MVALPDAEHTAANGTYASVCRIKRYVRPDVVKQMLVLSCDRCEHRRMTETIHSFDIFATVQSELLYKKLVAARRARHQE